MNLSYQICRTAKAKSENPNYDEEAEEFFYKAQMYWCNVRGARYQTHEEMYLRDVFLPHSVVFEELFGIPAEAFVQELMKIWRTLTFGLQQIFDDLESFQNDCLAALDEKLNRGQLDPGADLGDHFQAIVVENGWEERRDRTAGQFVGTDLYDVEKLTNLPKMLVDVLAWRPGEDVDFFAEGDFKGWPLRIWPTFKRPFIQLRDRTYCFDLHSLFDNIYRVMQRVILRLKPAYAPAWNMTQQALSEDLPFKYLQAILPGAKVYKSVYYRWYPETDQTARQWCEADGLLVYDDHLFVVECRGGAFTYTPPATDFPAFIASLKNLVLKPANQGKRFFDYLCSADTVSVFDKDHNPIDELRWRDFRHISICPVTLDPFTEMAAQVQHLRKVGVNVGAHPIWAISVDDLRVYADIFDNPLQFLHYVEQRNEAFKSDIIQADDELDHLGLYLEHNHYSAYAAERRGRSRSQISFTGYRANIDKFFLERLYDSQCPCPLKQQLPTRLNEIIDYLAAGDQPGRSQLASYLLDLSGEGRDELAQCIESELKDQPMRRQPRAYSAAGGNLVGYTVFCYTAAVPRQPAVALSHAKRAMVLSGQPKRLLLELSYAEGAALSSLDWTWIESASISQPEMSVLQAEAETLRQARLIRAKDARLGKIGRNEPCPCGSGKKYKKCCISRSS